MPKKGKLKDRLHNYCLFLEWLRVNNQKLLSLAYKMFVKETGLEV